MFKFSKHKLPKFPKFVIPLFNRLCQNLSQEAINELEVEVEKYKDKLYAVSTEHGGIDIDLLNGLYRSSKYLMSEFGRLDEEQRKLAIGAIQYFIAEDDPLGDLDFESGLNDDARVMNHVLEKLGYMEQIIKIS